MTERFCIKHLDTGRYLSPSNLWVGQIRDAELWSRSEIADLKMKRYPRAFVQRVA